MKTYFLFVNRLLSGMRKIIIPVLVIPMTIACNNNNAESDAYGNFEAIEVMLAAETSGKIIHMPFFEGDVVENQSLLCIVDTNVQVLQLEELIARQKAVETQILNARSAVDVLLAEKAIVDLDFKRIENMHNDGAATKKQYDDLAGRRQVIQKRIESAHIQVRSVEAELNVLKAKLNILKDQLRRCHIYSPVSGTILEKFREEGELIAQGQALWKVADLSTVYLRAFVSGKQLPEVKIGQDVEVRFDLNEKKNQLVPGVVSWISSSAEFTPKIIQTKEERVDLVYAIKVRVPNDGRIKIGMPGEVKW
jgi:HlyD family secretion protein